MLRTSAWGAQFLRSNNVHCRAAYQVVGLGTDIGSVAPSYAPRPIRLVPETAMRMQGRVNLFAAPEILTLSPLMVRSAGHARASRTMAAHEAPPGPYPSSRPPRAGLLRMRGWRRAGVPGCDPAPQHISEPLRSIPFNCHGGPP